MNENDAFEKHILSVIARLDGSPIEKDSSGMYRLGEVYWMRLGWLAALEYAQDGLTAQGDGDKLVTQEAL